MDELEQLRQRVRELENRLEESRQNILLLLPEFSFPLTGIRGFASMLLDDKEEDVFSREDRQEYYAIILENVERIQNSLDYWRENPLSPTQGTGFFLIQDIAHPVVVWADSEGKGKVMRTSVRLPLTQPVIDRKAAE